MMKILSFINSDYSVWNAIIQFGIIAIAMVIANVIRRKVKLFRNLLFPTAIIGGFIGLGLKYLIYGLNITIDGNLILNNSFLEMITYHTIAIGFIAMGLRTKEEKSNQLKGRPIKTGLVIVNTYLIQGIISVLITIVLANYFLDLPAHAGLLLPMAFGQGPGQAANIGGVFESYAANPFNGGRTFGLAIATFGFIWSSVGGIFYLNRRAKEGKIKRIEANTAANVTSEVIEAEDEIPVIEAIDKMSIQIIFIIIIYFFAYLFMKGITELVNIDAVTGLVWGFNFIFAMLFAIVAKQILNLLRKSGLMKRKYTNNYMLNRIAGVVFDFMIVASIMSIDLSLLFNSNLWIALIIISTIGGFLSYFYLKFIVKRIYPDYEHEAFATLYGTLTGTASNGISLLREIDPAFKTPAADDLVGGSSSAVMFGAPILAITAIIYLPEWYYLWGSLLALVLFFVLFSFFLFKQKVSTKE